MIDLNGTLNALEALGTQNNVDVVFLGSAQQPIVEVQEAYEPVSNLPFGAGRTMGLLTRILTLNPATGQYQVSTRNVEQSMGGVQDALGLNSKSTTMRGFVWLKAVSKRRENGEMVTRGIDSTVVNKQIKQVLDQFGWEKEAGAFRKFFSRGKSDLSRS